MYILISFSSLKRLWIKTLCFLLLFTIVFSQFNVQSVQEWVVLDSFFLPWLLRRIIFVWLLESCLLFHIFFPPLFIPIMIFIAVLLSMCFLLGELLLGKFDCQWGFDLGYNVLYMSLTRRRRLILSKIIYKQITVGNCWSLFSISPSASHIFWNKFVDSLTMRRQIIVS